jgi:capsule polysaccharide export protein KpsE/RkpR
MRLCWKLVILYVSFLVSLFIYSFYENERFLQRISSKVRFSRNQNSWGTLVFPLGCLTMNLPQSMFKKDWILLLQMRKNNLQLIRCPLFSNQMGFDFFTISYL